MNSSTESSLSARLASFGERPALIHRDRTLTYTQLSREVERMFNRVRDDRVSPGRVVGLEGDFTPGTIAMLFALFERGCVVTPLRGQETDAHSALLEIAEAEWLASFGEQDSLVLRRTGAHAKHPLLRGLRQSRHGGLILFSSGTSSTAKAALHDGERLFAKFDTPRKPSRMLAFLLFDHIGGVNTMLHTLLHGGSLVCIEDRAPDLVAETIERHHVEVLPTSPTFLNLMLLSGAHERHDLSSLRVVSYGTEPMSELTLRAFHEALPWVKLHQTYGMTELGILPSRSRGSDSLWMAFDRHSCDYRVRDELLEVKVDTAMLGYLNAPELLTEDGWLQTGDEVEVDGDWIHVLGRPSELINVAGSKVVPAEVEGVMEQMENVRQVIVSAEPSPLTGQIVLATVYLSRPEPLRDFRMRMREHCRTRLPRHMIPQKVVLSEQALHSVRHKKQRPPAVSVEPSDGEAELSPGVQPEQ
jgi:long-chain acyl-CoA synthetase